MWIGLPWWFRWQRICLQCRRPGFDSQVGKIPWRRECILTPVFLPEKFHGHRSLAVYNPWGCKDSDTTEQLSLTPLAATWMNLENVILTLSEVSQTEKVKYHKTSLK